MIFRTLLISTSGTTFRVSYLKPSTQSGGLWGFIIILPGSCQQQTTWGECVDIVVVAGRISEYSCGGKRQAREAAGEPRQEFLSPGSRACSPIQLIIEYENGGHKQCIRVACQLEDQYGPQPGALTALWPNRRRDEDRALQLYRQSE